MKYLKSEHVKVFPCAFRGSDGSIQFNPEARLNTEYSLTRRHASGKDSYIISYEKDNDNKVIFVRCVIGGYYFELNIEDEDIKGLIAAIKASGDKADSDAYLLSWEAGITAPGTLDKKINEIYRFTGLNFLTEDEAKAITESLTVFKLPILDSYGKIISSSCLQYKAENALYGIESNLAGTTITGSFIPDYSATNVTSAIVQLNNGEKNNSATANNAIALGDHTTADKENLVVVGKYNKTNDGDLFVVGNGRAKQGEETEDVKSNVLEVGEESVVINKPLTTSGKAIIANDNDVELSKTGKQTEVKGKLKVDQSTNIVGDFTVNETGTTTKTSKFKVEASSGNTSIAGNISSSGRIVSHYICADQVDEDEPAIVVLGADDDPIAYFGHQGDVFAQSAKINTFNISNNNLTFGTVNKQFKVNGTNGNTTIAGTLTQGDATNKQQVIFNGNIDATNGVDITGNDLTVGDTNFVVKANGNLTATGQITLGGTDGNVTLSKINSNTTVNGHLVAKQDIECNGKLRIKDNTESGNLNSIFDIIYPVGSIYISMDNKSPANLFGIGTWEQLSSGSLWAVASEGTPKTNPKTTAGSLPGIYGKAYVRPDKSGNYAVGWPEKAFSESTDKELMDLGDFEDNGSTKYKGRPLYFKASSGNTTGVYRHEDGNNSPFTDLVRPTAYHVYMWVRTK